MATVGGGYAVSSAIAFGMPDVTTQNFYAEKLRSLSNLGANSGFSEKFLAAARTVVETVSAANIIDKATAAINKVRGFLRPNVISRLITLEDLQVAGTVMQSYLMTDPVARARFKEQRMHGYKDTYVDPYPHLETHDHPDYRDSVTGLVQNDEDGGTYWGQYLHSYNITDTDADFYKLSSEQKFNIEDSRLSMRDFLAAGGSDPSDGWNGKL